MKMRQRDAPVVRDIRHRTADDFQLVNAAVKLDGAHLPELVIFKNL